MRAAEFSVPRQVCAWSVAWGPCDGPRGTFLVGEGAVKACSKILRWRQDRVAFMSGIMNTNTG